MLPVASSNAPKTYMPRTDCLSGHWGAVGVRNDDLATGKHGCMPEMRPTPSIVLAMKDPPPSLPPSPPTNADDTDTVFPGDHIKLGAPVQAKQTYTPPSMAPSGFWGMQHPA